MIATLVALGCAVLATAFLTSERFARSESCRAAVTPLASIIGSGFLTCGLIVTPVFLVERRGGRPAQIAGLVLAGFICRVPLLAGARAEV